MGESQVRREGKRSDNITKEKKIGPAIYFHSSTEQGRGEGRLFSQEDKKAKEKSFSRKKGGKKSRNTFKTESYIGRTRMDLANVLY